MKQASLDAFPAQVPASLRPALARLLEQLDKCCPDLLAGLYLIGSIALEAYEEGKSDVDFVAVLKREPTSDEWNALATVLRSATDEFGAVKLDGAFWLKQHLADALQRPVLCYRFEDGQSSRAESTFSPVDCWLLNQRPVVLRGNPWPEIGPAITWSDVIAYMRANLNSYWRAFTYHPRRLAWLLTDEGVEWATLGVSRLWCGIQNGVIVSKVEAGQAVLAADRPAWAEIVGEGLALRRGEPSRYRSRYARAWRTSVFAQEVIGEFNH